MASKKNKPTSKKKKIIWRVVIFIVLAGLFYGGYYIYARLPIITAYAAKDMCSCVFIGERNSEDVLNNEFQFSLVKHANAEVDMEKKSVTATVWGMGSKTAYYHTQKGCAILNQAEVADFLKPVENISEISIKNRTIEEDLSNPSIDYLQLNQAISAHFEDSNPEKPFGTRAVIVLRNGKLIAENYAAGFDKNSKHLGWSMTKSIFSALIGIAIKQDYISSVEEDNLFKEWQNDDRKKITLRNLLQMNSGLKWTEDYGDISEATLMLYENDDMVSYAKSCELEAAPGVQWEYSSGTTNLLSGLLRQRMDYPIYFNYPYQELFAKIGAPSFALETDASGNYVASSYSWATARDWAKFGQFYLDKGVANGEQILPDYWIDFTKEPATGSENSYGAQFWLPTSEEYPSAPEDMYFADGFQGQRIFVIPSEHLVIVRLGLSRFDPPNYDQLIKGIIASID